MQAATNQVAVAPTSPVAEKPKSPRSRMMRQYDLVERVRSYNPDTNEDLLNRAYVYAMKAHGTQTRASGDPYFSHPLEVAAILTNLKLDDATIVAALLHDTIEDTEATRAEIDNMFGHEIGALVDPGQTELLAHGSLLQHVSVIMTDHPPVDEHSPPWQPPAAVTLRPDQARALARELLELAERAQRTRPGR